MTLDEVILEEARNLRQAQLQQEHLAARAKVDFQDSVRRLHAAGGSLREIAEAFGVSHQWVHQIVGDEPPGKPIIGGDIACSFCRSGQKEVKKLIAGPGTYICDQCIYLAVKAITGEPSDTMVKIADGSALKCRFCGKRHAKVAQLVEAADGRICNECVDLCLDILADDARGS